MIGNSVLPDLLDFGAIYGGLPCMSLAYVAAVMNLMCCHASVIEGGVLPAFVQPILIRGGTCFM
jgi:hypothetical protein